MELVNQPAHPLFWTERERYKICGVCKGKFSCELPTYYDLFESFTGKEIGDKIRPLSIIGATTLFDRVCKMYVRKTPFREKMLSHWINSAYLICRIYTDGQIGKYWIKDKKTQSEWYVFRDFLSILKHQQIPTTGPHSSKFNIMRRHCHHVNFRTVTRFTRLWVRDAFEM